MSRKRAFVVLAVTTALGILATSSAAWSFFFDSGRRRGGFVIPCSLDGVNSAYHPWIFGDPAVAYSLYGFIWLRPIAGWQLAGGKKLYTRSIS
jgi:hypothetical protein